MKRFLPMAAAMLCARAGLSETAAWRLWYRQPAATWNEALPVGNGHLGAMVFGGAPTCRIQFNEHTMWTGFPRSYARTGAAAALPEIRRLLAEGRQKEAEALAMRDFMSVPLRQERYQPCGDLFVELAGVTAFTDYTRELDLATGLHRVAFTSGGTRYTQETFASHPARALVHRVTADRPGGLACTVRMTTPHPLSRTETDGIRLTVRGMVQTNGVRFQAQAVVTPFGRHAMRMRAEGDRIVVSGADEVVIRWTAATDVKAWDALGGDPDEACRQTLSRTDEQPYHDLRDGHVADHRRLFDRCEVVLPRTAASAKPTDERLRAFRAADDPDFAALVFQYGRYLLIGCSRADGQPANLQGIWNESLTPPWDSKYTCNINTQMNGPRS